jgi:hypothetical protein
VVTKLKATLPQSREANAMPVIREQLLKEPFVQHVLILVVDCHRIIDDLDTLVRTPVARIVRIEPETDPDRAAELLGRARELSDGRTSSPEPLLDPGEATGLQNATGLRLAGGNGR